MNKELLIGGLIGFVFATAACIKIPFPTDGIYLIPKGYTGDVIIVFAQQNGVSPDVENGRYVYRIPSNGILRVKTKGITGFVDTSYYYVDENGARQKIEAIRVTGDRDPSGLPQNKYGNISQAEYDNKIFVMNTGGLGNFKAKEATVQFTSFIVGTPKDGDRFYDRKQKRISEIQRELSYGDWPRLDSMKLADTFVFNGDNKQVQVNDTTASVTKGTYFLKVRGQACDIADICIAI